MATDGDDLASALADVEVTPRTPRADGSEVEGGLEDHVEVQQSPRSLDPRTGSATKIQSVVRGNQTRQEDPAWERRVAATEALAAAAEGGEGGEGEGEGGEGGEEGNASVGGTWAGSVATKTTDDGKEDTPAAAANDEAKDESTDQGKDAGKEDAALGAADTADIQGDLERKASTRIQAQTRGNAARKQVKRGAGSKVAGGGVANGAANGAANGVAGKDTVREVKAGGAAPSAEADAGARNGLAAGAAGAAETAEEAAEEEAEEARRSPRTAAQGIPPDLVAVDGTKVGASGWYAQRESGTREYWGLREGEWQMSSKMTPILGTENGAAGWYLDEVRRERRVLGEWSLRVSNRDSGTWSR